MEIIDSRIRSRTCTCYEYYGWFSCGLFAMAALAFVARLHNIYGFIGWLSATMFCGLWCWAVRFERIGLEQAAKSSLHQIARPLAAVAVLPFIAFLYFFIKAGSEHQDLDPPYNDNKWLAGISFIISTKWAVQLALFAHRDTEFRQDGDYVSFAE